MSDLRSAAWKFCGRRLFGVSVRPVLQSNGRYPEGRSHVIHRTAEDRAQARWFVPGFRFYGANTWRAKRYSFESARFRMHSYAERQTRGSHHWRDKFREDRT